MDWLIYHGSIKGPNPVIPRIHRTIKERPLPKPYSDEELETIRRILNKHWGEFSRAAVAIGEETGLRTSETSNVRIPDVDWKGQRILVRLPTKTSTVEDSYRDAMEEAQRKAKEEPSQEFSIEEFAAQGHKKNSKIKILNN